MGGGGGMMMGMGPSFYFPPFSMFSNMIVVFVLFLLLLAVIIFKMEEINPNKNKMEKSKFSWLRELVNFGGTIVGIVLTAVGGVMLINSVLKVYVFQFDTNSYFNAEEMCQHQFPPRMMNGDATKPDEKTEEEKATCVEEKITFEKGRYSRQQHERMIDGAAFLLVGAFLWLIHRRKKKNS